MVDTRGAAGPMNTTTRRPDLESEREGGRLAAQRANGDRRLLKS